MDIITRQEAVKQGLVSYFTGKPCKFGHISTRQVSNSTCLECGRAYRTSEAGKEKKKQHYALHKDRIIDRQTEYSKQHKERISNYQKEYRDQTTEKRLQYHKQKYREDKEARLEYRRHYYQTNICCQHRRRVFHLKNNHEE